jgi:tetratricopeptide (TPR) repeat protein
MIMRFLVVFALATLALGGCGGDGKRGDDAAKGKEAPTVEEIYAQVAEARRDLETTEEKLAVTKKFLSEHPVSGVTGRALDAVLYYQGDDIGDMAGAIAYAEQIRAGLSDPAVATAVDKVMIPWYGRAKLKDKMTSVADRLAESGSLGFNDHYNVIESAVGMEDWGLVRAYCEKALPLASAEAYKSEYPEGKMTDDEVARAADRRMGMLLVMQGWARANQGEIDAALADMAKADGLVPKSYVGAMEFDLGLYHPKVLMMKGDYEGAIERFATEALVMGNEEALAGLKEAYAALRKDGSGFDAYAAKLHRNIAKAIEDFELADYEGARRRFSDLRADVTVLAFWFPT